MPDEPPPHPTSDPALAEARTLLSRARGIVVLTGAGVSAESGVPTFRGIGPGMRGVPPRPGISPQAEEALRRARAFPPEALATPEAFARDPAAVWAWYDARRHALAGVHPNAGHLALARFLLAREDAVLVTQNVDGLHGEAVLAAGGTLPHLRIHELHGSLARLRCQRPGCDFGRFDSTPVDASSEGTLPRCPRPGCGALLRPAVVWFGEALPEAALEASFEAALEAEVCIVAGTSALVHPAASVPLATLRGGGVLIEVNPEATPLSSSAHFRLQGPSAIILPELLDTGRSSA